MSEPVALKPVPKPNPQLMPHRGREAKSERRVWRYFPEPGHTKDQILNPEYWAHVARQHRHGDKIEVLAEDGAFYGELLVISTGDRATKTHVLQWQELGGKASVNGSFDVQWKGPVKKFAVVRKSDGAVIHDGVQTKDEAAFWLEQNKGSLT